MKKTLAILLALVLALSMLPAAAMAAEGDQLVTAAGDTVTEGALTLREAVAAVTDGGTVSFADGLGEIRLDRPLVIDKTVKIQLNGQTITAAYDTTEAQTTLAALIVGEHGDLTLQGKGTIKAAATATPNLESKPTPFGIFVEGSGDLTVKDNVGITATDDTARLISLGSNTTLTLDTGAALSGGAAGVIAPSGASAYTVTIRKASISSMVALSLADTPSVSIADAVLHGDSQAIDASLPLSGMAASGYRAFIRYGGNDAPISDDDFGSVPDSSVTDYVFKVPPVYYEVTYEVEAGHPMGSEPVEEGHTPTGMDVQREGYIFKGWEPPLGPVTADTTYVAQWALAHTVTWTDGQGHTVHTETVEDGQPVPPFEGVPDTREGYRFIGWDTEGLPATVTEDITITAKWEKLLVVKYVIDPDHVLQTDYVQKGESTPAYKGETPTRDGYTFTGWDPALPETVTEDITFTAKWAAVTVTHTVTYVDGRGNTLHTDTVKEGQAAPAYTDKPVWEGHIFTGWDPATLPETITEDITVIAQWAEAHTVTYVDGLGNTLHTDTVAHGQNAPAYTVQPTREGYAFQGWDKSLPAAITEDITLTATWVAVHTVTYVDGQGNTLHTDKVNHGQAAPVYSGKPTREGYSFTGWDKTLSGGVTEDVTITAQWKILTFTVKYVDGEGKTLHTDTVEYGKAAPAYTDKPTREGHIFKGWDKTLPEKITEDITLTAQWESVTAPSLTSRAPVRSSETGATFYFTSSDTGYYYYLIRNPGAEIPSVEDLTTKGVSGSCQAKTEASVQLKNLSNKDAKDVYIMVKNEAGVRSSIYRINIPAYVAPVPTYSVTLNNGTGYTLSAANGSTSPVKAGGSYSFTINVQNGYARGSSFNVLTNGAALTGSNGVYTISNINADQNVTVTGIVANSSQNQGGGGYAPRPTVAAPSVTTTVLPSAVMGQEYKQQLTASGGAPITWSYTGTLPEGITLSSGGLLSGTPKAEGTFRFAVKVTNSAGTMTRQLSLVVAGNDYTVTQGNNAEWSQGTEDGITFQGSGQSAFTVRIDGSAVPASKLTLSQDGKSVTVSPEYLETLSTGSHTLTLVYTDGSARAKFNIRSTAKTVPPTIAAQPMSQEVKEGDSVTFTVTASGSNPAFQWQVDTGDGQGWTDIPGANAASYTVDGTTEDQTGWQYRCVITNAAGEAESNAAILTVKTALGEITADAEETKPAKKNSIGKVLLFAGLALAAIGLTVGLVIYFRRRNEFDDDDYSE